MISLGALYDGRTDRFVPSFSLWSQDTLESQKVVDNRQQEVETDVYTARSIKERISHFDIEASITASFLGGLIEVSGSAGYLSDRVSVDNEVNVELGYHTTKYRETLPAATPKDYPEYCASEQFTHVVTSVLYGLDAYFVFKRITHTEFFSQMHVGEAVNKHGMEVNVEANHPVLRNRDAIYIPSNVKIMTVYPGVKSDPEKHLVLEPRTEFKFLTSLVRELKNTHKFKSHRSLPENIHILAGVCLGIPRGNSQQDDMGKHVVDELVAYAGKLHADLLRTGNAHGMFDPTSIYKLAPKFKPTGKLVVVGASEAREFTNRVETAKTQILAENTWSVKRNYVTGSSQEMSQSLVERAFKKVQDDQGDHTVVIWILSNLMMIDRNGVLNIRTETHKEYRDRMEAIAQEKYGLKYEARRLRMGRVFKGKIPIHLLNSRMRTEGEVNDLLVDVCRRVNQLAVQRKGQIIVVGPMPRHPSRCCDDNEHMQKGFVSSDYTKRCYLISSFLELVLEQKNIYVLHPGQVYGWDREPAVSKVVANDGVHLNDDARRRVMKIIVDRLDSFKPAPESTEADTSKDAGTAEVEEAEGKLGPEDYLTKFLPDMDNFIYVKPVSYPDFEL